MFSFLVWIFVLFSYVYHWWLQLLFLVLDNSSIGPINSQLQLMMICSLLIWVIRFLWKKGVEQNFVCLYLFLTQLSQKLLMNYLGTYWGNRGEIDFFFFFLNMYLIKWCEMLCHTVTQSFSYGICWWFKKKSGMVVIHFITIPLNILRS